MPEENLNLEGNMGTVDLNTDNMPATEGTNTISENISNQSINEQDINIQNINNQDAQVNISQDIPVNTLDTNNIIGTAGNFNENIEIPNFEGLDFNATQSGSMSIDNSLFLDSGDEAKAKTRPVRDGGGIGKYLRLFFWATTFAFIGLAAIALLFSFDTFISKASLDNPDMEYVEYVNGYKSKLGKVKETLGLDNAKNYSTPNSADKSVKTKINEIINATDIDFIEKKDLLRPFISDLVHNSELGAAQIETIKQEIAKQGFLPEEINTILSEEQAIDTIQRSLNALEVIKFSTATKVFSYLDSALVTISEMVKVSGSTVDAISKLLNQISLRGEKDISAYVYMCYLNPFETNANCDTIGDLDLYYNSIIKDDSLNIRLFKNTMNAINQILEKEDTALFSITFNGFNAQDKDIAFNIEVYTNQNDERSLIAKGKKNPNIFILTNIINLLKQSSFIIGANIFTKEVHVDTKTITLGGLSTKVNYSNMEFTVPIQKSTEREIFDYIDLDNIQKILNSLKSTPEEIDSTTETQELESTIETSDEVVNLELDENNEPETTNINDETNTEAQTELQQNDTGDSLENEDNKSSESNELNEKTELSENNN